MPRASTGVGVDPGVDEGLPLAGVAVLDLTINIAGPYATLVLGDLGADVLKVEPRRGDDARRMAPVAGTGSAYFFAINRNKRSLPLDLRDEADRRALDDALGQADVLVTNLRPDTLRTLQLDFDVLHHRWPRLVYADLSGYGNQGLEADRPGYDMVLQARAGLMSVNGEPGRMPVRVGVSILDMGAGIWLALGVLAALRLRERTGRGGRVSTSLLEVGAAYMAYDLAAFQLTGSLPGPRGSEHPAFAPYGAFRTSDGHVAIGVGADRIFGRLARTLGRPEWIDDERFCSNEARVANREELRRLLEKELARLGTSEVVALLVGAGVPADEVVDAAHVLDDAQLREVGSWVDVPLPEDAGRVGSLRLPGLPVRFSQVRPPVRLAPPPLDAGAPPPRAAAGPAREGGR